MMNDVFDVGVSKFVDLFRAVLGPPAVLSACSGQVPL